MDCVGLAVEWESSAGLREQIRVQKRVLKYAETDKYCKPTRINAVNNSLVIIPVLTRLGKTESFRLPHLEDLGVEVTTLFSKCGLDTGNKLPYKTSVEIKRLTGFVKRRSVRKEFQRHGAPMKIMVSFRSLGAMVCKQEIINTHISNNVEVNKQNLILITRFHSSQGLQSLCPCQDPKFHELILAFDPSMKDG